MEISLIINVFKINLSTLHYIIYIFHPNVYCIYMYEKTLTNKRFTLQSHIQQKCSFYNNLAVKCITLDASYTLTLTHCKYLFCIKIGKCCICISDGSCTFCHKISDIPAKFSMYYILCMQIVVVVKDVSVLHTGRKVIYFQFIFK